MLLATAAVLAFAFPIGELPAELRLASGLAGCPLEASLHTRTDLEVASLVGDGCETGTKLEDREALTLRVVGVGHQRPLVTTGARAWLLEAFPGEPDDPWK